MRALLALFAAFALVVSVAVGAASGLDRPQNFSVLEIDETDTALAGFDFQREPVPGDRFAFKSGLYKWAGVKRGSRVGHDEGTCTFIRVSATEETFSADAHCSAQFFLPTGSILVEAFAHFSDAPTNILVPVIGGTGAFANARGTVRIRDIGAEDSGHSAITFHLLP